MKFPRYRPIRVLASLSLFLLLFCGLLGSIHIAHAAFILSSAAQTETTITLSWSQSSDLDFYSYTLWFSTNINGPYSNIWSTGNKGVTSYAVSSLSSATPYYFYVADAGLFENYNTNTLQVTTASNPQLTPTGHDYSSASLAWTDYNTYSTLEPFVSYTLQISSSGPSGPWSSVTSITDPSQNNFRVLGLAAEKYWFQLYDTVGPSGNTQSSYSNIVNQTIPPPPQITIASSVNTLDATQTDQLSSTASNGVPPYSYQWYLDGTSISGATSSSYTFTPNKAGTYSILATVQDTLGIPVDSNTISVKVNPLPVINISASSSTLTGNQTDQFSSTASGGATPYSYRWYSNGNPIVGATSSSFVFIPDASGTYIIYATIQDYYNATASSNSILVNVTALLALNVSASTYTLEVGQLAQFVASASSGNTPYSYQWYLDGNPIASATSSTYTFTPNTAGTYSISATVQDYNNVTASSNTVSVSVTNPPPSFPLVPIIIIVLVAIIIAAVLGALFFRSRNRNKTQKTK